MYHGPQRRQTYETSCGYRVQPATLLVTFPHTTQGSMCTKSHGVSPLNRPTSLQGSLLATLYSMRERHATRQSCVLSQRWVVARHQPYQKEKRPPRSAGKDREVNVKSLLKDLTIHKGNGTSSDSSIAVPFRH